MRTNKILFICVFLLAATGEIFSQGTWATKAPVPGPGRWAPAAFAIGNKGYVGTGENASTFQVFNDFWEYDPITNGWTQKANFGGGQRVTAVAFSIGNFGYMGTGQGAGAAYYNDLWRFDPISNSWTQVANMPGVPRKQAFGFSIGGKGYIGTGVTPTPVTYLNDMWEYDPGSNTWAAKANYLGGPRMDIDKAVFVICDKAYLGTGRDNNNSGTGIAANKKDFWEYDPATDLWTQKANFPGVERCGATGFSIGSMGYLGLGSRFGFTPASCIFYNNFWQYNPTTNAWSPITSYPGAVRFDAPSFVINNKAYVACGSKNATPYIFYSDLYEYTPVNVSGGNVAVVSSGNPCSGQPVTLTASGGSSYTWSTGANGNPIIVSPSATTTYTVSSTGVFCGGSTTSTATITVTGGSITPTVTGGGTICAGQVATLTASGGNTYSWNTGATTASITPSPAATTTYSVLVSSGGCSGTTSVTVTVGGSLAPVITGNTTICPGQFTTLTASGGNTYSWNNGATTTSIIVSPGTTTTYSVVASAGGCSGSASETVTVNSGTTPVITGNTLICTGDVATLTASGGSSYSWSNGATTASITVSPATTTNYSVSVTGGCSGTASTTLVVTNAITAGVVCQDVCGGNSATLVASGGGSYLWSNGSATSAITVSPAAATSYTVIVGAGSSCADTTDCTVNVFPGPTVSAASDTIIETGGIVTLTATGSGTYAWSNGSTDAIISVSPTVTTQYAVTVTDANGCTATAYVTVTVDDPCSLARAGELFVPNAFSPNGDNENDVLQVYYGDFNCLESITLTIYDRWGEKVFFAEGELASAKQILRWDGTYKGKLLSSAAFVYYLNATLITGEKIIKKGNVSLMK